MSPVLAALVEMQKLDTAAETTRRRLAEMPVEEKAIADRIASAAAALGAARERLAENGRARRELEKEVAVVDGRLARFDDHKAAVKTNQEFTALLHEIATAKGEKDGIEDRILELLESADAIAAEVKVAEAALAEAERTGQAARADLARERQVLDAELGRLAAERSREAAVIDPVVLGRYEQLLRARRMVAVAAIDGELCTACHVRLRPAVVQQVRRNNGIIVCDSCQRILYFVAKEPS
jgi:predicted  nucleic acid-binding Zn-ribbon protein